MPGAPRDRRDRTHLEWRLVGRKEELRRLGLALVDDRRSVVLAGRTGVGKSRLGQEALDVCRAAGFTIARVAATRASSEIPLGAFVTATFLGILPLSFIYANIGAGFRAAFATHKHLNLHSFPELRLVLSLMALGLLALAPVVVRHLRGRPRA